MRFRFNRRGDRTAPKPDKRLDPAQVQAAIDMLRPSPKPQQPDDSAKPEAAR